MLSDWLVWCWTCTCAWLGQIMILYYYLLYHSFFLITHFDIFFCPVWWLCRWLGGKKVFLAVPCQVQACVFSGLLYSIVGTLPSLIMKYDLPCSECTTEEWWCKIIFSFRIAVIGNKGIVIFDLMSQYRKGTHVRNQPQFDFLSPLYSNPPVWPGEDFARGHNGWEPKEIPRADLEGLVGGHPMLADGSIIWRFVLSSLMYVMGHLRFPRFSRYERISSVECGENCETSENYQLNVARHAFSCSMRFVPIWSGCCSWMCIMPSPYQVLRCICFVWWCQVFQHGHRMGWVSRAPSSWSSLLLYSLCATLMSLTMVMGDAQFASASAKKD